jgi:hypothetical protein
MAGAGVQTYDSAWFATPMIGQVEKISTVRPANAVIKVEVHYTMCK